MKNKSNLLIQLTGEYYVCAELCKHGILAQLAPKNNPLFDIVATTQDGNSSITIQVKTMDNTQGWILGKLSTPDPMPQNLYVVLVQLSERDRVNCYIFKYANFLERVKEVMDAYYQQPKKDGSPRKKVGFEWFDLKNLNDEDRARVNDWSILSIVGNTQPTSTLQT